MFRKRTPNIEDDEFNKYDIPHIKVCSDYLTNYVIPDYIAFYIATGYYKSGLSESSFLQHFNSAADMFNLFLKNKNQVIIDTKKALKIKYSLEILEEKPILKVKEI